MKTLAFKEVVTLDKYEDPNYKEDNKFQLWFGVFNMALVFGPAMSIASLLGCPMLYNYRRFFMGQLGYALVLIVVMTIIRQIKGEVWSKDRMDCVIYHCFVLGLLPYTIAIWILTNIILIVGQSIAWIFVNFWRILLWIFLIALGVAGVYLLVRAIVGF
ncbi:MAG: hypothetical protein WCO23_02045 [bacterium]